MASEHSLTGMTCIVAIVCGTFLGATPAYAGQEQPYFHPWEYAPDQFKDLSSGEKLTLHNRCVMAATYAMLDSRYSDKEAKSVHFFHLARAEDILRVVPYGHRVRFNLNAGSIKETAEVYKSLGWTRVLKATIGAEMKSCAEMVSAAGAGDGISGLSLAVRPTSEE
ncbi:hypothetical protein GOB57_25250 [Sinorhizobium meliloti]|nr:hypothetical protein [Sinorhizobium meliloti]